MYVVLRAARREWGANRGEMEATDDNPRGARERGGGNLKFSKRPEPEKTPYFRVVGTLLFLSFNPWAERITLYTFI